MNIKLSKFHSIASSYHVNVYNIYLCMYVLISTVMMT